MYSEKVQVPRKLWIYLNECRDEDHGDDDLKLKRNEGCIYARSFNEKCTI